MRSGICIALLSTLLFATMVSTGPLAMALDPSPDTEQLALPAAAENASASDPFLSVKYDGGNVLLSWPVTPQDWVLEETAHLNDPITWTVVPGTSYQSSGGSFFVTVLPPLVARFYRLRALDPAGLGLTGYWPADEGSGQTVQDLSGSTNALSLSDVGWRAGYRGSGALRFNGAAAGLGASIAWVTNSNYRVLPAAGQPFTVSFWLNPEVLSPSWIGLVGTDANGRDGWHVALRTIGPGTNELVLGGPGASVSLRARAWIRANEWRQLAASYDGTNASLYLDGRLLVSGPGTLPAHQGSLYFGGAVGGLASFLGRLDELRVYSTALSREDLAVTAHWRFDENGGTVAGDASTHGVQASVGDPGAWVAGRTGSGIDLARGRVTIPQIWPATGRPFSLSCWVYPRDLSSGRSGVMNCVDGSQAGWSLELQPDEIGQPQLRWCSTNSGGTLDLLAPVPLNEGQWNKLDLTFNGGIATLYLNGTQMKSESGGLRTGSAPLILGAAPGLAAFDGILDELIIYDRERAADEIGPVARVMWETALINSVTNLLLQGTGPVSKNLTFTVLDSISPTNGTLIHSPGSPIVTYQAGERKGPDAFAYTVSDGEFTSPPATVALSVVQPHWLAPDGGSEEPRDGASPTRAWVAGADVAMDAIVRTNNYYDCFFYAPGEYQMSGHRFGRRTTAYPGCKHMGSGKEGPQATTLKLVNASESTAEGLIFGLSQPLAFCDGFEVNDMTLDCNAQNNPMYSRGELNTIVIPLATTSQVDTVKLRWSDTLVPAPGVIPGRGSSWRVGRALQFYLCTRSLEESGYVTNCLSFTSTGRVDVVPLGVSTDQIILQLERRANGVDFYSLEELEVTGAAISLPSATALAGGESQLASSDARYSILSAVDGNPATAWASGLETQVEIVLPVPTNRPINRVTLNWNCQTVTGVGRLGPAANIRIRARALNTQTYYDVPSVAHDRAPTGLQFITFGTAQITNAIVTDRVVLVLDAREPTTDYYSLREIALQNGASAVSLRIPTASSTLAWSGVNSTVLAVFDKNNTTRWASRTQGMVGAFDISGSNIKLTHLRIVGFGTKAGREGFPVGIRTPLPWQSAPVRQGNVLVEDCILTQPATNNADGLTVVTVLGLPPHILTNAIVRRCAITGAGQHFAYSQGFHSSHVENCLVEDCDNGVYFEPDRSSLDVVSPVMIRSNVFRNVRRGLYLLMHPGARFDSIICMDNEIIMTTFGGYAIGACDTCVAGPSGTITNFTVLNNIIRYPDWTARPQNPDGGFYYSDIQHAVVANNIITLGTPHAMRVRNCPSGVIFPPVELELCPPESGATGGPAQMPPSVPPCVDPVRPGYRRAWYNNTDLSNTLIPVRYYQNGGDGLASEQQLP